MHGPDQPTSCQIRSECVKHAPSAPSARIASSAYSSTARTGSPARGADRSLDSLVVHRRAHRRAHVQPTRIAHDERALGGDGPAMQRLRERHEVGIAEEHERRKMSDAE
jgi:hypothetical protein